MELVIRRPDDWHVHIRSGDMLKRVLPYTIKVFGRALIMPNVPPLLTIHDIYDLSSEVNGVREMLGADYFVPVYGLKITPTTTPAMVIEAARAGAKFGKVYPKDMTTGSSEGGVTDFEALYPVFEAMQGVGMVLCLHGELPGTHHSVAEQAFLPMLRNIVVSFPTLRVVLEHVSSEEAVEAVYDLPDRVGATITAHHMVLTQDNHDNPHHCCAPMPKTDADRQVLVEAATSGNPKFFLGSDSAPHMLAAKEADPPAFGVYTAPVLMPLVASIFDACSRLDTLEQFTSISGAEFYGYPLNEDTITLVEEEWLIPPDFNGVVPVLAGEKLHWKIHETE